MDTDTDLYHRWLADRDEAAFADLARRHANLVFDVAWRLGGDRPLAENALQEALLRLATDGTDRPVIVGIRAWLARLSISKALNARASRRARVKRAREAVGAAFEHAKGEDAALLSMRCIHGLDNAELGSVLGVAEFTARVRVHRALARLRKSVRRDDIDEKALAGLVAAIPSHVAPAAMVEAAIAAAVSGETAGATAAVMNVAPWVPRALAIGGLALLVLSSVGLLVWLAMAGGGGRGDDGERERREQAAQPEPYGESTLRGRPSAPSDPTRREEEEVAPPWRGEPSKTMPPPGPAQPALRQVPLRARLVLLLPDGTEEDIAIQEARHRGTVWEGKALITQPDAVRVQPGKVVTLTTADPRAAFTRVAAYIPEPPTELVLRIPSKEHPGLDELVLEVVDAETGLPLPDAWLEWGAFDARHARVPADGSGRIRVRIPEDGAPQHDEPLLARFGVVERTLHAPGYYAYGDPWGMKSFLPGIWGPHLDLWLERGIRRIALKPLPKDGTFTRRRVRILDAAGRPSVGAYVLLADPVEKDWREGSLLTRYHHRFRRADAEGLVDFSMREVVGLQVQRGRVPIAAWGLSASKWPEEGPRVLRLPPIADAELVVEGLPEGASSWSRDPLGAKRRPRDGNAFPLAHDAEAKAWLDERRAHLPMFGIDARGDLEPPTTTMRLPLPVGRPFTFHLYYTRGTTRVWTLRTWTVQADAPGPLRLTRQWEDLPETE